MPVLRTHRAALLALVLALLAAAAPLRAAPAAPFTVAETSAAITIATPAYTLAILRDGFRYELRRPDGGVLAGAHPDSGLLLSEADGDTLFPVTDTTLTAADANLVRLQVTYADARLADVTVVPGAAALRLQVRPAADGEYTIDARTAAPGKGYGMGDYGRAKALSIEDDDVTTGGKAGVRFVSNFVVFPAQGLAQVLFWEGRKRVTINAEESRLGVAGARMADGLYYFVGSLPTVYAAYKQAKADEGYPDQRPKPRMFEVGWEAYGALGWNTNQAVVTDKIDEYLERGYPLGWAVVGSRTWRGDPNPITAGTTRFGMWDDGSPGSTDPPRYPDPPGFKQFLATRDIKLIIGLRINMDPENPFYDEAEQAGYFIPGHEPLIDTRNPAALDWYIRGANLWGVDGFKEDLCCGANIKYLDAKANRANERLMAQGSMVIVRNSAWSVPGDLIRREDTEYAGFFGSASDLVDLAVAYAASAAPNYYPDIVGGTNLQNKEITDNVRRYVARNATIAATMPAMAFGYAPWELGDDEVAEIALAAATWHSRHAPYISSAAADSFRTGFPHTLTPLMLAYPDRPELYDLETPQWMLGPSIMAIGACYEDYTDIPGDDCQVDVRLPPGKWLDPRSGELYQGPGTIAGYRVPLGAIAVLVGGSGIVVTREPGQPALLATAYPSAPRGARYSFTHPDGTVSTITADNTTWDPATVVLQDLTTGLRQDLTQDPATGGLAFPIAPGHSYRLTTEYRRSMPLIFQR